MLSKQTWKPQLTINVCFKFVLHLAIYIQNQNFQSFLIVYLYKDMFYYK